MGRTILVTGGSGALGPHLLAALLHDRENDRVSVVMRPGPGMVARVQQLRATILELGQRDGLREGDLVDRLRPIAGDIRRDHLGFAGGERFGVEETVDAVIHAAANTRFTATLDDLREVNVEGTRRVLDFARRCPRLQQFVLVSTTCVAGTRVGSIAERLEQAPGAFVNSYEQTKWEAERLVAVAGLPSRIARLGTCIGEGRTGYVHRFGAIHQSVRWLVRGLVPMLPVVEGSRVDFIATDLAARWLARALTRPVDGNADVCHIAAGQGAITVGELVDVVVVHLRETASGWAGGHIEPPLLVDATTFELFERSVVQSGDPLFARVLESARSFFPALLHPKVYDTTRAEALWGGPLPPSDWRSTLRRVIDFGIAHDWRAPRRLGRQAHA